MPNRTRPLYATAAITAVLAGAILAARQQTPPLATFRSGVELVLVDVTVLDKGGRQIADLQPGDFSIEVAGKKRPLVAAQFVRSGHPDAAASRAATAAPGSASAPAGSAQTFATSVALIAGEARSILVVVDVDNIRLGEGRGAMDSLAEYFDTLPSSDEVGFIALPSGMPRLELTSDRVAIRSLLSKTFGVSGQLKSCEPTLGEAAAWAAGDERGLGAYGGRAGLNGLGCVPTDKRRIDSAILAYRRQTLTMLRNLTNLAEALGKRPGKRAIVLVSEGLYGDVEIRRDIEDFGEALERARVVLYAVHLDFPFMEASTRTSITLTRRLDDRFGFDAMADAAVVAGGEAIRAISRATPAIKRIDAAMSGGYVLAFERIASDTDGKRLSIDVKVSRQGADVRARSHVTIGPKR